MICNIGLFIYTKSINIQYSIFCNSCISTLWCDTLVIKIIINCMKKVAPLHQSQESNSCNLKAVSNMHVSNT